MEYSQVIHLMQQTLFVSAEIAAPLLIAGLVVGLVVSIVQAATSVQEMSLTFIPKTIALGIALLLTGGWMLSRLVQFSRELLLILPTAAR